MIDYRSLISRMSIDTAKVNPVIDYPVGSTNTLKSFMPFSFFVSNYTFTQKGIPPLKFGHVVS